MQAELSNILPELFSSDATPTVPARKVANLSDVSEQWDDAPDFPDNDDNRIVALLARRAAE